MQQEFWPRHALLTADQIRAADRRTIAGGIKGYELMNNAGTAVAKIIRERFAPRRVLVLCGGGNNGGDGLVIARLLHEAGVEVTAVSAGKKPEYKNEAGEAWRDWKNAGGKLEKFSAGMPDEVDLCVDAVFGIGLARAVEGEIAKILRSVADSHIPVVAVDMPSGIHTDTGEIMGEALPALLTVTFFRGKPGLCLLPGKAYAGEVMVADIGIPGSVLEEMELHLFQNHPDLWELPVPDMQAHKYTRGHVVVAGGAEMTGAARLVALGALRAGAGLVSIACPAGAHAIYASNLLSVITRMVVDNAQWQKMIAEPRVKCCVIGPGLGVNESTREKVRLARAQNKPCVLDADALTAFSGAPKSLFRLLDKQCVLTPHEGEFEKLFSFKGTKMERAVAAAQQSGAVIVLKGGDTVIAAPDGIAIINTNAPPTLATAGSGDVLAGIIAGLLAQGMSAFHAAAAGVWIHGDAAQRYGLGLIAEDLPAVIPSVLADLFAVS